MKVSDALMAALVSGAKSAAIVAVSAFGTALAAGLQAQQGLSPKDTAILALVVMVLKGLVKFIEVKYIAKE